MTIVAKVDGADEGVGRGWADGVDLGTSAHWRNLEVAKLVNKAGSEVQEVVSQGARVGG